LPSEPATPDANAQPGQPAPRPLAGPIVPLVASSIGADQLLGGPGARPTAADPLTLRALVKGEPLVPPAGRADDFVWPRREAGHEQAKGETPMASTAPDGSLPAAGPLKPLKPKKPSTPPPAQAGSPSFRDFFGFGPSRSPATPPPRATPKPPANVGRSASAPGFFTR